MQKPRMKKLHLDDLEIEAFATTAPTQSLRGTVAGHATGQCTYRDCPESWDGTCWMSCWNTCTCDTEVC